MALLQSKNTCFLLPANGTPSVKKQVLFANFELSFYQVSCIRQVSSTDINSHYFQLLQTHHLHSHASFIVAPSGGRLQASLHLLDTLGAPSDSRGTSAFKNGS
jgi:hypothetical protein